MQISNSLVERTITKQNQNKINKNNQNTPNFKGIINFPKTPREFTKAMINQNSRTATVMIESCVTTGRSVNAYKRGGFPEARERFCDDFISAVFWMGGVDMFNKIGDFVGKHIFKLPETNFDVGKDVLRTPFENCSAKLKEQFGSNSDLAEKTIKKLQVFKFSKAIISTILATGFVGFALPKINQAVTEKMLHSTKKKTQNKNISQDHNVPVYQTKNPYEGFKSVSFADFSNNISSPSRKNQSFKGLNGVAYSLEHNNLLKLLTTDIGMLAGRTVTARNKDEAREFLFRDSVSMIFYYLTTPYIDKGLRYATSKAGMTAIDPVAAKSITDKMCELVKNEGDKINSDEFRKKTIGVLDDTGKKILENLPFNSDVISFSELSKHIKDKNLLAKAKKMAANLQPEQAGVGKLLTKQQVADVLKNGSLNTPEFMGEIFKNKFGEDLLNEYKYIPFKDIKNFRNEIDTYANSVIEYANKKNNGVVTKKLLEEYSKKGFIYTNVFRLAGMAFSAFMLAVVIPKVQYALTAKRTGSNAAPGLRAYEEEQKK